MGMIFTMMMVSAVLGKEITLNINDKIVESAVAPMQQNGTTLVPLRVVSENLGAVVEWNEPLQSVTIFHGETELFFFMGEKRIISNMQDIDELAVAPKSINGTTMVPLRVISEALGCAVDWDSKNRVVTIKGINLIPGELDLAQINRTKSEIQIIEKEDTDKILISDYGFSIEVPRQWRGYYVIEETYEDYEKMKNIHFKFVHNNIRYANIITVRQQPKTEEFNASTIHPASAYIKHLATDGNTIYTISEEFEVPVIFRHEGVQYDVEIKAYEENIIADNFIYNDTGFPKIRETFKLER